ncbi:MAG: hypothetical protein ACREMO_06270, partial [Gemmatimonadales bacterium]
MLNLIAALATAGFFLLGLRLALAPESNASGLRWRADAFLLCATLVSLTAGLSGRDLWPFSSWRMMRWTSTEVVSELRLYGVDAGGVEYLIDYRAWEPLSLEELISWLDRIFPTLAPAEQDSAATYLLAVANQARERAQAGTRLGVNDRWLGPLAAPTHLLHPRHWEPPSL